MLFGGLSATVVNASVTAAEGLHSSEVVEVRLVETDERRSARIPWYRRPTRRACEPKTPVSQESSETPTRATVDQLLVGTSPVLNFLSRFSSVPTYWSSESEAVAASSSHPSVEPLPTLYADVGVFVGSRSLVLSDSRGEIILSSPFQQFVAVKFHLPRSGVPAIASDGLVRAEGISVRGGSSGVAAPPCIMVGTPLAELQVFTCTRQVAPEETVGTKQFDCVTVLHANKREGVQTLQAVKQRLLDGWGSYLELRNCHCQRSAPHLEATSPAAGISAFASPALVRSDTMPETRLVRPTVEQVLASARGATAARALRPVHELTSALSRKTKQFLWNPSAAAVSLRSEMETSYRSLHPGAPCGTADTTAPTSLQDIRITVLSGGGGGVVETRDTSNNASSRKDSTSSVACDKNASVNVENARRAMMAARALLPSSSHYSRTRPSPAAVVNAAHIRELPLQAASSPVRWSVGGAVSEVSPTAEGHCSHNLRGSRQDSAATCGDPPTEGSGCEGEAVTSSIREQQLRSPLPQSGTVVAADMKASKSESAKVAAPGPTASYPLTCVACGSVFDLRYRTQHLAECNGRQAPQL